MSQRVAEEIRRAIADRGPITFDEFMELALYGEGGFYERPPVGTSGDFVTSPHVHPVFGRLLAGGMRQMWMLLDRPDPFAIVEAGAGDGMLASELLDALEDVAVWYVAVERSSGAVRELSQFPIGVATSLREIGPIESGVVVANELLDNLPFRRVRGTETEPVEISIGVDGDRLVEVETPCDAAMVDAAASLRPGEEATVPVGALDFIDTLADALTRGYALLIDYGGSSAGAAGAVHGYRAHRLVQDVLADPGSADITAGVDFGAIAERAKRAGLTPIGPVSQRAALLELGFERWSLEERERQTSLLADGSGLEAVRAWGSRSRASLLIDPTRLGGFEWLGLSTPGLEIPSWLSKAAERRGPSGDPSP